MRLMSRFLISNVVAACLALITLQPANALSVHDRYVQEHPQAAMHKQHTVVHKKQHHDILVKKPAHRTVHRHVTHHPVVARHHNIVHKQPAQRVVKHTAKLKVKVKAPTRHVLIKHRHHPVTGKKQHIHQVAHTRHVAKQAPKPIVKHVVKKIPHHSKRHH